MSMEDLMTNTEEIKKARTETEVSDLLCKRWSGRAYTGEPLTDEQVLTLIEAAHWAPSSMNEQPWKYYFALQGTAAFNEMWTLLMDGNKPWVKEAGALVLCTSRRHFERNGMPNRHYMHDAGAANMQFTIQATEMGLNVHMLGGYHHTDTVKRFGLDEHEEPVCFLAVGPRGDVKQLEEPFKSREIAERKRKPLNQIAVRKEF